MGKPIREFESRPLRKPKGNVKTLPFFVRRNPVDAFVQKMGGEQKTILRSNTFLLAGTPAATERYAISHIKKNKITFF